MKPWLLAIVVPFVGACSLILTGDGLVGPGPDAGGACVELTSDPKNCGRCGKDCLGGACVSGKCQPAPFATEQAGAFGVAVDATHLYWSTTDGRIVRKPLTSGDAEILVENEVEPAFVAVNGTHVYWTSPAGGTIRRVPIEGGAAETVLAGLTRPTGIVLMAPTVVFWSEQVDKGKVWQWNGTVRTLYVSALAFPTDIDVTPGGLFYIAQAGSGVVGNVSAFGGIAPLAHIADPAGIATSEASVFVVSRQGGQILRLAGDGVTDAEILVSSQDQPVGIAVDLSAIYWTELGAGRVWRLVR